MNKIRRIAIDFDGTIVHDEYPKIGSIIDGAKDTINMLHNLGIIIIINSCRTGKYEQEAKQFLLDKDIHFDYFNENDPVLIEKFGTDTRKISADLYIDDKNLFGTACWQYTLNEILEQMGNVFVVGLCGRSGSGKSYFADKIKKRLEHYILMSEKKCEIINVSMADSVKSIAKNFFGWDNRKDKKGRELLIGIGNNIGRKYNKDLWVDYAKSMINLKTYKMDTKYIVIIDDIRYYNETALCDMLIKIDIPFYKKIRQFFEIWRWSKSERGLWLRKIRPRIKTISTVNNKKEDYTKFITEWLVMQINIERFERREND